jgi:hypothetical protein
MFSTPTRFRHISLICRKLQKKEAAKGSNKRFLGAVLVPIHPAARTVAASCNLDFHQQLPDPSFDGDLRDGVSSYAGSGSSWKDQAGSVYILTKMNTEQGALFESLNLVRFQHP